MTESSLRPVEAGRGKEPVTPSTTHEIALSNSSVNSLNLSAISQHSAPGSPQRSVATRSVPTSPQAQTSMQQQTSQASSPMVKPTTPQQKGQAPSSKRALPMVPLTDDKAIVDSGMVLGLEQLERQQAEAERRRQQQSASNNGNNSIGSSKNNQHSSNNSNSNNNNNQSSSNNSHSNNSTNNNNPATQQQQTRGTPAEILLVRPDAGSEQVIERFEDGDESTEPSSTVTGGNAADNNRTNDGISNTNSPGHLASLSSPPNKFGRIFKSAKRQISSSGRIRRKDSAEEEPVEDEDEMENDTLIGGPLQKLGRNGKWQTRWFETDGECLSYYKSSKRTKLLATLDLAKVGEIVVDEEDAKGCSFTIQVLGRPYYLRAESKASCKDWVITLNRVKEARLEQGNIKLVSASTNMSMPPDLLDENVSEYTPRVVAIANRQRTRAVDEMNMESWEVPQDENNEAEGDYIDNDGSISTMSHAVLAQWQKRRTKLSKLANKLARWARSLKKYNCAGDSQVRLDQNIHPPGHDDKFEFGPLPIEKFKGAGQNEAEINGWTDQKEAGVNGWTGQKEAGISGWTGQNEPGLSGWIGKETARISRTGAGMPPNDIVAIDSIVSESLQHVTSTSGSREEEEEDTRVLS